MSKNLVGFLDMGPKHVAKGINKGLKRKEKTMKRLKRTEIDYKCVGDKIQIIRVRDAVDSDVLADTFGVNIADAYIHGFPRYVGQDKSLAVYASEKVHWVLYPNITVSFEKFGDIIRTMKMAGSRLAHIVKNELEAEKTVRI